MINKTTDMCLFRVDECLSVHEKDSLFAETTTNSDSHQTPLPLVSGLFSYVSPMHKCLLLLSGRHIL